MNDNLKQILKSKLKAKQFVNKFFPITDFLPSGRGLVCCPFHNDSRPSAKMFYDDDYPKLYCYACNKQYGSADYIEQILGCDVVSFINERVKLDSERVEAFSDSFVYTEYKAKECPINDILESELPEFTAEGLNRLLFKIYDDKERYEFQ